MAAVKEFSLEYWLNKATDPNNQDEQWDCIREFCDLVDKEADGSQIAVRFLAHKIQSPQEKEALHALMVLETCMNNCGKSFHYEVGKFRFLNELIKVLSPKYLGTWSTEKVKSKIIEMLYSWTLWLTDEVKIKEAYKALKKQGIIKKDPELPENQILPPPSPRQQNSIFDKGDTSKLLSRLLSSGDLEDLQNANRLIKSLVQEDQEKMEKASRRQKTIEEVRTVTSQLNDMLISVKKNKMSEDENQKIKTLYERCEKLRPTLFRMASETVDSDEALADILKANDELAQAVNQYKQVAKVSQVNGGSPEVHCTVKESKSPQSPGGIKSYHLIDFSDIDSVFSPVMEHTKNNQHGNSSCVSLLDEELMTLGLNDSPPPEALRPTSTDRSLCSLQNGLNISLQSSICRKNPEYSESTEHSSLSGISIKSTSFNDIPPVGKSTTQDALSSLTQQHSWAPTPLPSLVARSTQNPFHSKPAESATRVSTFTVAESAEMSLSKVFVPLVSINPDTILPVTVYDKNGFRVMLHFSKNSPPGRPDVLVAVVSMLSTSPHPTKDIIFQAAVPKCMRLKLQHPSGSELPAFNPLLPPTVISQVLLLANPRKEPVRLRFKLSFVQGNQTFCEVGDVNQFPDVNSWGTN
ncbi:ADP-ribosylation factor-binding protein GGA1-like [Protopterus annectens]|uniref:ADP-ribosylation factor-binding protein GGA1-like n=1 Tax=Protopterus annectens TaxID=7888 RepID=UPI001CF9648D|nr:ADP-ribosylation factor-binding protein GGA1-like [Protopterus annectens]